MVKLTSPMMSMGASGTIGKQITFASWKGISYGRQRVIPSNPQSAAQMARRAMMTFISQAWTGLSAPNKASWDVRAAQRNISPFNAYCGYGNDRWTNFKAPSKADPATETGTAPSAPTTTPSAGVKEITLSIADGADAPDWAWLIYRSLSLGFTPSVNTLWKVLPRTGTPSVFVDTGLTTGTPYYYRVAGFMATGKMGALEVERTATPT